MKELTMNWWLYGRLFDLFQKEKERNLGGRIVIVYQNWVFGFVWILIVNLNNRPDNRRGPLFVPVLNNRPRHVGSLQLFH